MKKLIATTNLKDSLKTVDHYNHTVEVLHSQIQLLIEESKNNPNINQEQRDALANENDNHKKNTIALSDSMKKFMKTFISP